MRLAALVALLASLAAGSALADEHAHLTEAEGLRIVHAWTRATREGEAFVFAEIENRGAAERILTGGEAEGAAKGEIVGFGYENGSPVWTLLPGVPVISGGDLHLEPDVLALRLDGLSAPLAEGGHLDLVFVFDGLEIAAEAEIRNADAREHSHAGHSH
jgi:copper(I)-binding protein